MGRQPFFLTACLAISVALIFGAATQAQEGDDGLDRNIFQIERPELDGEYSLLSDPLLRPFAEANGPVNVVIELGDTPTAQIFAQAVARVSAAQATAQAQQQLSQIQAAQQTLLTNLQAPAIDAQVIYRTQRVFNGIAVEVDAGKLGQIQSLPGVKAIHPLLPKQLDNATSVPFIGADRLWAETGLSVTGDGIRIGIIDTGIDYIHTNFGGDGSEESYEGNDPEVIGDSPFFPSVKVAGGYDFVGDNYNAGCTDEQEARGACTQTPQPDPDPMDCDEHGTHVAGTAGGYGVSDDGSTYEGPYGPDTPFADLRIGPGVAPEALLYALKVFGCPTGQAGSTDVTDAAIEWAVDPNGDGDFSDRLDVINMSLGSPYGSTFDTSAIASDNAAAIGVVVVASAGNSGDTYYITGAPAASSRTISVASSVDAGITFLGIRINSPEAIAGLYEAAEAAFGPELTPEGVTGDIVYAQPANGCSALTNAAAVSGKIALIDRGGCTFVTKVKNAQNAGAIAVIVVNNVEGPPIPMGGDDPTITIPSVMISQADGQLIKDQLAAGNTVNVTLSSDIVIPRPDLADTLSNFSSRGPRRNGSMLKPDIAAPGQSITSAQAGSGTDSLTISGTSMAAPHVAGAMALLRQIHPDWSVEELKALAMNTANNDLRSEPAADAPIYGPGRVGAGRITLVDASLSPVIAYDAESEDQGLVSVSFGAPEVVGTATATKMIRVLNKSPQTQTYTVAYRGTVDVPGVSYSLSTSSVSLSPYGVANIAVTMSANADEMKHTHDETVDETQRDLPRHWLSEEAGHVILTSTGGNPPLRVPVYAAPRPASAMRAKTNVISSDAGPTSTRTIELVGQDVLTGVNFPIDEVSIVTAFELQHSSPNDPWSQGIVNNADLKYVGVASDFGATGAISNTVLAFGIATQDNWSSPNEVQFNIFIDTNRDGEPDFRLLNTNYGRATGSDSSDTFITVLVDLRTGEVSLQAFLNGVPPAPFGRSPGLNTVPFNTNVMMLPVFAADLGLTDANATFDYRVVSVSRDYETEDEDQIVYELMAVDSTPFLPYNAAAPGVDLSGGVRGIPAYFDLNGASIPVIYNRDAFEANNSQGILLLHHHNATPDRRPEVVTIVGDLANKGYLPLVTKAGG